MARSVKTKSLASRASTRKTTRAKRSPPTAKKATKVASRAAVEEVLIPTHIRAVEGDLDATSRAYIRRKIGRRLGKFSESIERVSVRTEDMNGPRGGVDRLCRIKVTLSGAPSVVFEARDAQLNAAIDLALSGVATAVRRAVQRRRATPRGKKD